MREYMQRLDTAPIANRRQRGSGNIGHSVMINRATQQRTTVFGIPVTRYTFHVMDPARGGGAYVRTPASNLVGQRTFLLFPRR